MRWRRVAHQFGVPVTQAHGTDGRGVWVFTIGVHHIKRCAALMWDPPLLDSTLSSVCASLFYAATPSVSSFKYGLWNKIKTKPVNSRKKINPHKNSCITPIFLKYFRKILFLRQKLFIPITYQKYMSHSFALRLSFLYDNPFGFNFQIQIMKQNKNKTSKFSKKINHRAVINSCIMPIFLNILKNNFFISNIILLLSITKNIYVSSFDARLDHLRYVEAQTITHNISNQRDMSRRGTRDR